MILRLLAVFGYLVAAGWIYYLTARVQFLVSELEAGQREQVLLIGRISALADYLGVDIHDPVPDGPDDVAEYVPDELSAPRELEQPDVFDPEPVTQPIVLPDPLGPATAPDMKRASAVGPLPVLDAEWEERRAVIDAEWRAAADRIGAEG